MTEHIAKALKETNYNAEVYLHFWEKDWQSCNRAYASLDILAMRDLLDHLKTQLQTTSFFSSKRKSELQKCIQRCNSQCMAKESTLTSKEIQELFNYLAKKEHDKKKQTQKKKVVKQQQRKDQILKAIVASNYDAEVFFSFERKDWEAASLAFMSLSIMKMKELIDDLMVKYKATSFFQFKRRKELQSCIFVCQTDYSTKTSQLTAKEREEFKRYLRKKEITASVLAQKAAKVQKQEENTNSIQAKKEDNVFVGKHYLYNEETVASKNQQLQRLLGGSS